MPLATKKSKQRGENSEEYEDANKDAKSVLNTKMKNKTKGKTKNDDWAGKLMTEMAKPDDKTNYTSENSCQKTKSKGKKDDGWMEETEEEANLDKWLTDAAEEEADVDLLVQRVNRKKKNKGKKKEMSGMENYELKVNSQFGAVVNKRGGKKGKKKHVDENSDCEEELQALADEMGIVKVGEIRKKTDEQDYYDPGKMSFNDFPNHIILQIFQYLDIFDLWELRSCCKLWHQLIDEDWRYHTIKADQFVKKGVLFSIIRLKVHLFKCVDLDFGHFLDDVCWGYKNKISNRESMFDRFLNHAIVESLTLRGGKFVVFDYVVKNALRAFRRLKSLSLFCESHFWYFTCGEMLKLLGRTERLYCSMFQRGFIDLCELPINELILHGGMYRATNIVDFCQLNALNLTKLKLTGLAEMEIYDCDKMIFEPLALCKNLKSLSLSSQICQSATDAGLRKLYGLKLESFEIRNANFTSSRLSAFFQQMSSLKKIALYTCEFVDSSVTQEIARCCKQLIKFTYAEDDKTRLQKQDILNLVVSCDKLKVLRLMDYKTELRLLHMLSTLALDVDELVYVCREDPDTQTSDLGQIESRMSTYQMIRKYDFTGRVDLLVVGLFKSIAGRVIRYKTFEGYKNCNDAGKSFFFKSKKPFELHWKGQPE